MDRIKGLLNDRLGSNACGLDNPDHSFDLNLVPYYIASDTKRVVIEPAPVYAVQ